MRLCFDATRFGSGLEGAIELATSRGVAAVEYSLAPFETSSKSGKTLKKQELAYFQGIRSLGEENSVAVSCMSLDYLHQPGDKRSTPRFIRMMTKLGAVAEALGCPRVSFHVAPGIDDKWKSDFEADFDKFAQPMLERGVRPVLRLSTPASSRGLSLKRWISMEPQDWRDLLSTCDGLSLSFSPADCVWLGIDYLQILPGFISAIDYVEANDVEVNREMLKDSGMFGPLWWRYRRVGRGKVDWRQLIEALKLYGYEGDLSIHLDDEFIDNDRYSLEQALDEGIKEIAPLARG